MNLIIFCHPDPKKKSHSHKILEVVQHALHKKKRKTETLDLYQEEFESCFMEQEYCNMKERKAVCENDVAKVQEKIKKADTLIFIYPVWWYNMPARLKGFMDRVFSNGFAYNFFRVNKAMLFAAWCLSWVPGVRYLMQPYSATGHLKGKKALIFRTYGGPALGKRVFGNTVTCLENVILRFCGLTNIKIHELYNCDKSSFTEEYERKYLRKVERLVSST
jgi:NAD(P)H dehydrogenase (quinone)